MTVKLKEIGQRLKAYRLGRGLSPEQIAERLAISRAAVYRIEAGEVVKIETLQKLASILETTVTSLLGVGVEYYNNALSYFERMRQIEESADQVVAHFPPMSYLLTSEEYQTFLRLSLIESLPDDIKSREAAEAEVDAILGILNERRKARDRRRLSVVNFVTLPEIERWLKMGVVGRFDLLPPAVRERRQAARREVEHLRSMIATEPMGVQIGVIDETLPTSAFQIFRTGDSVHLGLSPFRLGGDLPNLRMGIAMMTSDQEPVQLYEALIGTLWKRSLKGPEAVRAIVAVLARSGVD